MKSEVMEVNFGDELDKDYIKELDSCHTLGDLQIFGKKWNWIAPDANKIIENMTAKEFIIYKDWREMEKKGKFQGEAMADLFSPIVMPEIIFKVSIVAEQFHVPWGLAFSRMKQEGLVKIKTG